jgi:hypothetical protein
MVELGTAPHVVEVAVNHISGARAGIAGVYNRAQMLPRGRRPWSAGASTSTGWSIPPRRATWSSSAAMPRPVGEPAVALGVMYPDGTVSDIECFPDLVTPEEFIEIIEWQASNGIRTAEEVAEILEWMPRNIVSFPDGGGSGEVR